MSLIAKESEQLGSRPPSRRKGVLVGYAALVLAVACVVVAHLLIGSGSNPPSPKAQIDKENVDPVPPLHSVTIRKPAGPPVIQTGLTDPHGKPITIACNTCHAGKTVNSDSRVGDDLKLFHQGLRGNHGKLACVACHNPAEQYASLRLADGKAVPYPEVMQLCAQCHGPQARDYEHGSHGGMNGYWDLSRGPRTRNNCIDCHDPHSPRYPLVMPMRGPNDRFLAPAKKGVNHE